MLSVNATGLGLFMDHLISQCSDREGPPLDIIKSLIEMGAPLTPFKHTTNIWRPQYPRLPSTGDQTFWPFLTALQHSEFAVCDLLIENGLDIKATWPTLVDLDDVAVEISILEYLQQHDIDLNARDSRGRTILMSLIRSRHYDLVDYLFPLLPSDPKDSIEKNAIQTFFDQDDGQVKNFETSDDEFVMTKLLRSGKFSVHSRDQSGRTLLMAALEAGKHVKLMMKYARDCVNDLDREGQNVLLRYLRSCYAEMDEMDMRIMKDLMAMSDNVNVVSDSGETCLLFAVGSRILENDFETRPEVSIYQSLIDAGANVHAKAKDGWTPLMMACLHRRHSFVSDLLARECDVAASDVNGVTPLMACFLNTTNLSMYKIVEALVARGASVDSKNRHGMTPLHFAVLCEQDQVLRIMVKKSEDINAKDIMGRTPLHLAVQNGSTTNIELLLQYGADISAVDYEGRVPLAYYFRDRERGRCSCFYDGPPPHLRYTMVHCCALKNVVPGNTADNIDLFHQLSIDASMVDIHGASLLHELAGWSFANSNNDSQVWPWMEYLLASGANVNAQDSQGNTFLHLFIPSSVNSFDMRRNNLKLIDQLCRDQRFNREFDMTLANKDGFTPLHLACQYHPQLAPLFVGSNWNKPADPAQFTHAGDAAIHLLVNGNEPRSRLYVPRWDVNLKNKRTGQTPLMMLVIRAKDVLSTHHQDFSDVVSHLHQFLALPGIDMACRDHSGRSVYDYGLDYCLIERTPPRREEDQSAVPTRSQSIPWHRLFPPKGTSRRGRR